ncbi:hypothetical protein LTR53_007819 [Teratosphaeriaceae sp. CCFEE 6253]|nr:hypothetical protein LTR53_007819 [Teratosphaeriaceae sp. CCFEE 6253]
MPRQECNTEGDSLAWPVGMSGRAVVLRQSIIFSPQLPARAATEATGMKGLAQATTDGARASFSSASLRPAKAPSRAKLLPTERRPPGRQPRKIMRHVAVLVIRVRPATVIDSLAAMSLPARFKPSRERYATTTKTSVSPFDL